MFLTNLCLVIIATLLTAAVILLIRINDSLDRLLSSHIVNSNRLRDVIKEVFDNKGGGIG